MTPDDKPSAPARKGFDASWTSRSEKTTAAPRAVAEPATVVNTKPSSAFERPMVLFAALAATATFAVWLQLGFEASANAANLVSLANWCSKTPMRQRTPYRLRNRALIGVYR